MAIPTEKRSSHGIVPNLWEGASADRVTARVYARMRHRTRDPLFCLFYRSRKIANTVATSAMITSKTKMIRICIHSGCEEGEHPAGFGGCRTTVAVDPRRRCLRHARSC
jgi:hypothetical protein